MVRTTEAIFTNGVLKPTEPLNLREQERVRITVEQLPEPTEEERARALRRFFEAADRSGFRSTGPYPTRDELHERR